MKQKIQSKIMLMMVAVLAAVALTSCFAHSSTYGDDYDIVGYWTSSYRVSYNTSYNLSNKEMDKWVFYSDGTGTTSYYNTYYQWVTVRFFWDQTRNGVVQLRYEDGTSEVRYYRYSSFDQTMMLSTDPYFTSYYVYVEGE